MITRHFRDRNIQANLEYTFTIRTSCDTFKRWRLSNNESMISKVIVSTGLRKLSRISIRINVIIFPAIDVEIVQWQREGNIAFLRDGNDNI